MGHLRRVAERHHDPADERRCAGSAEEDAAVHGDDALARVGQGGCAGGAEDRVSRDRQRARERLVLKRDLAELCRRRRQSSIARLRSAA